MSKTFAQWWDSSESQAFGWRHKDVAEAAWTAGQRASQEALGDARKSFQALKRLAADPMRSWETGPVVDAARVEDIADEAIELINVTLAEKKR